jgi:hypothetical protein
MIEKPNVHAVPAAALTFQGDRQFVWLYADGKSKRAEVRTGLAAEEWVEVTAHRPAATTGEEGWVPINGSEKIILGDLSVLAENGPVKLAESK